MNNELRQIELVTARTRLEREQLLLQNERDKRRRVESAVSAAHTAVGVAGEATIGLAWLVGATTRFLFAVAWALLKGAAVGFGVCAIIVNGGPRQTPGDFLYRLELFIVRDGWMIVVGCCVIALIGRAARKPT